MSAQPNRTGIDPRGPQFGAALTVLVLAGVLLAGPGPLATVLLSLQAGLFAIGAVFGVQYTPQGLVFKALVRPRLAPPTHLEDPAPPRFAQGVGLAFAVVGLAGFGAGIETLGLLATGLALVAAMLNAAFGFCLGCEMYLLGKRMTSRVTPDVARAA